MKTSEVEVETGISKQTLHFYEAEGLLEVGRDTNDYRSYSEQNIQTLQMIRLLRDLEVSIDDIKKFLVGELSLKSILDLRDKNLDRSIAVQKDIQDVVQVLKKREIPLVLPFEKLERELGKSVIGYWRTSDKVSIGRRLNKGSLLRTFSMFVFNALVFSLALMIGIPKMIHRPLEWWGVAIIFLILLSGMLLFFVSDLLTTGSPIPTSRFKFVEFTESGITYYDPQGIGSNIQYVLNALKGQSEKSFSFLSYQEIDHLKIKAVKRYMGGRVAMDVTSVDFEFIFMNTKTLYIVSPLLLDRDSYWLAHIIKSKMPNVSDEDGILDQFAKGQNINKRA